MTTYLWQVEGWTKRLDVDVAAIAGVLAQARLAQGRLLGRAESLGIDLGSEVRAQVLVGDAVATSTIEGETVDVQSVRSSVARQLGVAVAGQGASARREDGLVAMLLDATSNAEAELTAERLHGWHAGLFPTGFSGIRRIAVGEWRMGVEPMRVVSGGLGQTTVHFEAPPSTEVPALMHEFLGWFDRDHDVDGLIHAAIAHLWFVTLHPYDDGNGRLARAITDMALARDEGTGVRLYSLSAQIQAERPQYYDALQRVQKAGGDVTAWVQWFLETFTAAVDSARGRVDAVLTRQTFWVHHAAAVLNERQTKVVQRMVQAGPDGFQGGMTNRKYTALTRTSRATAQRELADLVNKGILEPSGAGGRSSAYRLRWPKVL